MQHSPADASATNDPSSLTDRRSFLVGLGLSACAGLASAGGAPRAAAADVPKPDPASGIAGIKQLLARPEPVTWVFTGDSITHGALHTRGWRSYPEHFAERVRWELKRMRDIV